MRYPRRFLLPILFLLSLSVFAAPTVRIKDIATLKGVRENQLLGIGLVTGLAGKGDSSGSVLLQRALSNLIGSFGFQIDPDEIKSKNCAVVMVSAAVPPFIRPGERIDLDVSSIGDAKSLEGGILLQTSLKAANGNVYALAQGKLLLSRTPGSVKTVGAIPSGGIVEREVLAEFVADNRISILLKDPDFVTSKAVSAAVREAFSGVKVNSLDASLIEIEIPEGRREDPVSFIGELESLTVTPDVSGKVVIDSQSGVIIIGENVRIGKVAVSYKSVEVNVGTPKWGEEDNPNLFVIEEAADVNDLIGALTTVGLETDVIIGIMRAIERAGALFGRLIVL